MKCRGVISLSALVFIWTLTRTTSAQNTESVEEPKASPQAQGRVITLAKAQEMASKNNPNYQNFREMIYQSDVLIQNAWSMLAPTLNANGSITLNKREIELEFPDFSSPPNADGSLQMSSMVLMEKWGKAFGFTANMSLFNPRSIPAIKLAYDMADRTHLGAQRMKNDLLFAVTSAYYQVYSMQELIAVAQESVSMSERFLKLSEAQKKVGQATQIDVLRAELQLMDAQKELANAQDALVAAKTSLAYLIGIKEAFSVAGPQEVEPVNENVNRLTDKALAERLELKEAALSRSIAERSKSESWMKWLPVFDVTYNWTWNSAAGFGDKDNWMLIFGAKWTLFDGGRRFFELKERESNIRMANNDLEGTSLKIREEIELGYQQVKRQKRNMDLAQQQVAVAEQNHHLVTRKYEVGMASSLDVMNAFTELSTKRNTLVLDRLQYDIAVLTLRKSVGEYHPLSRR